MQKIDAMVHQDGEHQGNLLIPINYVVIFPLFLSSSLEKFVTNVEIS